MTTKCKTCDGTGESRRIAVVGEPAAEGADRARRAIQDAVRPGDHVICFSDFAQSACGDANHFAQRERRPFEACGAFDLVIDISAPA